MSRNSCQESAGLQPQQRLKYYLNFAHLSKTHCPHEPMHGHGIHVGSTACTKCWFYRGEHHKTVDCAMDDKPAKKTGKEQKYD